MRSCSRQRRQRTYLFDDSLDGSTALPDADLIVYYFSVHFVDQR